jgi:hypothetical protein
MTQLAASPIKCFVERLLQKLDRPSGVDSGLSSISEADARQFSADS